MRYISNMYAYIWLTPDYFTFIVHSAGERYSAARIYCFLHPQSTNTYFVTHVINASLEVAELVVTTSLHTDVQRVLCVQNCTWNKTRTHSLNYDVSATCSRNSIALSPAETSHTPLRLVTFAMYLNETLLEMENRLHVF